MRLRWKILLYSSTLLLALLASILVYVDFQAEQFVRDGANTDLSQGIDRIYQLESERLESLELAAGLVASFPDLKALLTTDLATIRDFLLSYQEQHQRPELLIVLDHSGGVIARTDSHIPLALEGSTRRWVRPLLEGKGARGILRTPGGVYHAAAMPAEAAGTVFGFVIAGAPIDGDFAQKLSKFIEGEVVIVGGSLVATTLPEGVIRWRSRAEWDRELAGSAEAPTVKLGEERYTAMTAALGRSADPEIRAVILRSRDRALAPYRRIRTGLLILVTLVALGGIGGSALLARTVTAPVAKLAEGTQQVAAGNLDFRLEVERNDELGELARSFNTMVSERKRLEEQFRQSQKMEAVGRLAGGVAHDFNNLLTAITGYAQLIVQRIPSTNRAHNQAEQILKAAERAASLTKQLLAFSRRQVLVLSVLDLNAIISDMKQMLARLIGEDVDLITSLDPGIGYLRADRGQVEQVIMNLAVNARDAMPKGGRLTIATSGLEVLASDEESRSGVEPGSYVVLSVSDTGIGMDAETLSHLFEPFYTTKETGKGTGLGLATVYGIIQQSNGHILVKSQPGRGSSFTVLLPRTESLPEEIDSAKEGHSGIEGVETVLLVEDEKVVRDLAELVLRARGYTVLSAPDGQEALDICRGHEGPISLMITDVVMPRMSGAELVRHALTLRPEMKILFISGYLGDATRDLASMDSETSFLQKPFSPDTLSRKVREILDFVPQNS